VPKPFLPLPSLPDGPTVAAHSPGESAHANPLAWSIRVMRCLGVLLRSGPLNDRLRPPSSRPILLRAAIRAGGLSAAADCRAAGSLCRSAKRRDSRRPARDGSSSRPTGWGHRGRCSAAWRHGGHGRRRAVSSLFPAGNGGDRGRFSDHDSGRRPVASMSARSMIERSAL